jgi:hypothetical protein
MNEPKNFSVIRRNFGHWDIVAPGIGRVFRIRGKPGAYVAMDEREKPYPVTKFKTLATCMAFICEDLMLQLAGSTPTVIDDCGNPVRSTP